MEKQDQLLQLPAWLLGTLLVLAWDVLPMGTDRAGSTVPCSRGEIYFPSVLLMEHELHFPGMSQLAQLRTALLAISSRTSHFKNNSLFLRGKNIKQ